MLLSLRYEVFMFVLSSASWKSRGGLRMQIYKGTPYLIYLSLTHHTTGQLSFDDIGLSCNIHWRR